MGSQYWSATMIGPGMPVAKRRSEYDAQSDCLGQFASTSWERTPHADGGVARALCGMLLEEL